MFDVRFDFGRSHPAFNLCLALSLGHQFGSTKADLGCAGTVVIIDRFDGP